MKATIAGKFQGRLAPLGNMRQTEPLFELWLAFAGLLLFAAYLLLDKGIWAALLQADPTYLTALIVILFTAATVWAGVRAHELARQRRAFDEFEQSLDQGIEPAQRWLDAQPTGVWAQAFVNGALAKGPHWRDHGKMTDLLAEQAAAPHEMAWWLNGILLKLGLLGKVIGFSILALQLGAMDSFDAGQTATVLKTLTGGLGIALLTTMTGLAANMLLGLQLMRLDRFADSLTAKAIHIAETRLQYLADPAGR